MDVIRPARLNGEPRGEAGYVGVCSDLVNCDKRYSAVIASLLGRTAVAETLTDAIAIARRTKRVMLQAVIAGLVLATIGMIAAAFDLIPVVVGAFLQEAIDVVSILWALTALIDRD